MGPASLRVVERRRLSDAVADQLLAGIGNGPLAPGSDLPAEAELARRFGVSKTVVREALGRLASMGAVVIQQGRPTTVALPSAAPLTALLDLTIRLRPDGLRQAIELRRAIETEVAALAAEHARPEQIAELSALLARMRERIDTVEPWVEADYAFHLLLARMAGNELIRFLMEALEKPAREAMRRLQVRREMRNTKATLARHVAIYEAVAARDPLAARAAMHAHFDASRKIVATLIREKPRVRSRP